MTVLCYSIGAALLTIVGALLSGGIRLPRRSVAAEAPAAAEDALTRDLAAMLAYGGEEEEG